MEKLIKNLYFKYKLKNKKFRRKSLQTLIDYVKPYEHINDSKFLCHHIGGWKTPCWKDIPECKQNINSKHLREFISVRETLECNRVEFNTNLDRIKFLEECLELLDK